jgi:hypothetical protein
MSEGGGVVTVEKSKPPQVAFPMLPEAERYAAEGDLHSARPRSSERRIG